MKNKRLSLYIHIPFCIKKCNYCDFLSYPESSEYGKDCTIEAYVDKLCQEIEYARNKYAGVNIYSVFIGGGTPSILSGVQIKRILDQINLFIESNNNDSDRDIEITIEANPGTVTTEKALMWKENRINRISMGLQSADNDELALLGRIHTYEDFLKSWEIITKAGFNNRSIDIISALPNQTIEAFERTLDNIISLNPEHISSYSLQLEEGTPFGRRYTADDLPGDDTDRNMYYLAKEKLEIAGYKRYEISNFSKPGLESKHNTVYWKRGNYLGLGLGAASLVENTRFTNTENMVEYLSLDFQNNQYHENVQHLSINEQMEEFVFLGLRLCDGFNVREFNKIFNQDFFILYKKKVDSLIKSGHLSLNGDILKLTDKGIDVSNVVLSEFLLD